MKKLILLIFILAALTMAGCMADDPWTETVYFKDAVGELVEVELVDVDEVISGNVTTENVTAQNVITQNVTAALVITDNATISYLLLNNLPESDPGISGAVWSDNGTLKVSQ
ncbi:MAG: hypothetical protein PHI12_13205 [Dehalococcoidales bacterium]|jgi:outer membrane lipoprotein SlyB|nr:hypothetical protein [Dehalococcoidales bacterium]